jgi:hypothetical protein
MQDASDSTQPGQLEQFIQRSSAIPTPHVTQIEGPDGPDTPPTVPFPSALELTGRQETALVERALQRIADLEKETGRDRVMQSEWYARDSFNPEIHADSWMVKRTRYEALFANDLSWRPRVYGGIYSESNLTVPLVRRITRQMIARAQNYFFATDPWFAAEPEGMEDSALAAKIGRYLKWKLGKLSSKRNKERSIRHALVRGECVNKTSYTVRDQLFDAFVTVLADEQNQPIMAADGEHITKGDQWQPDEFGQSVLARDGQTPAPAVPNWQRIKIKKRHVLFEGPESVPVYFKDFLAPLTALDLQTADCIAHLYDKPVIDLVNQFLKAGMLDMSTPERIKEAQKAVDLIRAMSLNTSAQKSGVNLAARPNEDEQDTAASQRYGQSSDTDPIAEIAEVYLWFDCDGDGIQENVMVLIDRASRRPIFYDHVGNLTPDGLRPFDVVRVNEVENRWYGQGIPETFDSSQQVVDLMVNRWNLSQSRAGRTDFWRPDLTLEGQADPSLKMNHGGTYTAKPDADPSKILTSVYLQDMKFDRLQAMFEFFMQMAMNESGVQHANDGAAIGMDTQKLATGIRNMEKAGQELFAPILSDLEPGLEATLNRELLTLLANLNKEEVFRYTEGDATITAAVNPEDVRDLTLDISLLLTRYKGEQQFQQMLQASQVVEKFYTLPPEVQAQTATFYQGMVKALDTKLDAETIISPLAPPPPIDPATGMPMGGPGMMPPPAPSAGAPPRLDSRKAIAAIQPRPTGMSPENL